MIDETLEKVPTVTEKAAELYADLVGAACRQRQWFTLADELPFAIKMNGDRLDARFLINAAMLLHSEGRGNSIEASLKEADRFETLQHAATTVRRHIKLADAERYYLYDRACGKARRHLRL